MNLKYNLWKIKFSSSSSSQLSLSLCLSVSVCLIVFAGLIIFKSGRAILIVVHCVR